MVQLKVFMVGSSLCLTIPAEIARVLNVQEGDDLYLTLALDGALRITLDDPEFAGAMEAAESFMARYRSALRQLAT